ncbi:hypothetical protein MGG_15584 [Pyricularia oryzae 70-15]|uniref:Uncharacterized protein n=3 Tax=Pyricularia oryzae TaxID=318829 RepID=G4MU98_PYRO7|nr:uncharacterized protein MGG_15584 [Pyricularia oryzae 70-15]EHA53979.1 hypothetical protein MGG_15584 [Pyricularia oryzae 70-15]
MVWAEMWFDDNIESDKSLFPKVMKPHKPAPACPTITSLPTLVRASPERKRFHGGYQI